eukprot:441679_1
MPSWYVENGCINVKELPPFWFTTLMVIIQIFWAIMMFKSTPSRYKIIRCCSGCIKLALSAFTLIQVIIISMMDIIECTTWIKKNLEKSGWEHFLCIGAIIMASSNFKTCITTMLTVYFVSSLWSVWLDDDSLVISWDDLQPSQKVTVCAIVIWCVMASCWLLVLLIPSLFVVGWAMWVFFIFLWTMINRICCKCLEDGCLCDCWECCNKCRALWLVIGSVFTFFGGIAFYIYAPLGMVNIYAGLDYKYAFEPLWERHWDTYWDHIEEAYFNPVIRFISWI